MPKLHRLGHNQGMSQPTPVDLSTPILTYNTQPAPPALRLPANACDSHVHVFGPAARFPYAATRGFTPVDAPKEALFALHRTLGIGRCVIVQSLVHGLDNRVVEDAIAAGGGRYLGVALVRADVPDAELARLAAAGFRGVRFNFSRHLGPGAAMDDVVALTHRLAPLGLHLQVHFDADLIHELAGPLRRSAVPVVIDHMARVDARLGAQHANFRSLLDLLNAENSRFNVAVDLATSEAIAKHCKAVHFREQLHGDAGPSAMTFDYVMREGVATTTNALKLLELVGLGEPSAG